MRLLLKESQPDFLIPGKNLSQSYIFENVQSFVFTVLYFYFYFILFFIKSTHRKAGEMCIRGQVSTGVPYQMYELLHEIGKLLFQIYNVLTLFLLLSQNLTFPLRNVINLEHWKVKPFDGFVPKFSIWCSFKYSLFFYDIYSFPHYVVIEFIFE